MATYYHTQKSGGDPCADNRDLYIMLYPNTQDEKPYTKSGSNKTIILDTLDQMGQELLNHNSISYYEIQRFHVEDYEYPNLTSSELNNISCNFSDYLKGPYDSACVGKTNGTGDDLSGVIGVHVLLHSENCTTDYVSAGGGTDDCNTGSAFTQGRMAWTSVNCSDSNLTRNSVVQEPLHQFILVHKSGVQSMLEDCDNDGDIDYMNEHALGKVWNNSTNSGVSPLLTYHADEEEFNCGTCKTGASYSDWDQTLTTCTKDAVYYTASDQCSSSPDQC